MSTVELAFTVSAVRVSSTATVRKPPELIVVPAALPVSTMDQITVWSALPVMATVAVNCCVPPLATPGVEGLTVTPVSAGGVVTVTVAVSDFVVSTAELTFTVSAVRVSPEATVRRPSVLIVVPVALLVSTMDQVTVCAGLLVPVTDAVNVNVPPLATLAVEGLTVTLVTVGGSSTGLGQAVKKRNGISAARTSRRCAPHRGG